jgi:hypothetical protein
MQSDSQAAAAVADLSHILFFHVDIILPPGFSLFLLYFFLSVVESKDGRDGGESDAGEEQRVPDFGLVVALHGEGLAQGGLDI